MKISQKHIQYILLLLIVIIAVCAYQFGYVKYIEKANQVKEENKTIETRINELTEKETHRDEWKQTIEKSVKDIKEILSKYGPGNTPEKSIIFVTKLEEAAKMSISSIAFAGNNPFYVSNDIDENGNPSIEMDRTTITVSYNTTYEGLKACFDYISNYVEKMSVNNFNANFNQESGQLSGSMVINLFGVKDSDHVYRDPNTGNIPIGTENIFGTVTMPNSETEPESENETSTEPVSETGTE